MNSKKEKQKIEASHEKDIPELIRILPITLSNARDVVAAAEQNHRQKTQNCMRNISQLTMSMGGSNSKHQIHDEQQKILAKIRKLKICQNS